MKIRNQVYMINFFSSLLPLVVLAMLTFVTLEGELKRSEEEKMELVFKKGEIYLETILIDVETKLDILSNVYINENKIELLKDMNLFSRESDKIDYFAFGSTDGKFLIEKKYSKESFEGYDPRVRPWYIGALKTEDYYLSDLFRHTATDELILTVSKKIEDNNKLLGVVVARINVDSLKSIFKKLSTMDEIYLVDLDGNLIINLNDSKRNYFEVKDSFTHIKGEEGVISEKDGIKMLYHIHDMKGIDAYLIGGISERKLMGPLVRIEKMIMVIIFGAILSIVILTMLFGRSFSMSLSRLSQIIDNIARGNYDKNVSKITDFIDINSELYLVREAVKRMQDEIRKREAMLKMISETDSLTEIFNRGAIMDFIRMEINRSRSFGTDFSLVMFDLDHFKSLNDTYGHQFGDEVLKGISKMVSQNIKDTDSIGRYGGEEFLILLSDTDLKGGIALANRVKNKMKNLSWSREVNVTASFGVLHCSGCSEDIEELLGKVDSLLYRAKKNGRDRVEHKEN